MKLIVKKLTIYEIRSFKNMRVDVLIQSVQTGIEVF